MDDQYSLRGRVYNRIRNDILEGSYVVDEAIKETQVSKELGVSRTPVREALRQLELEELVTIIPNKGAVVQGITPKDIQDIYAIRSLVEGLSARWAAEYITEEQLKDLEEIIELAEFYVEKNDVLRLHELDNRFHKKLYEASHSKMLKHILSDLHKYAQRVRKASIECHGRAEHSIEEHKAILEALENRDGKKAEKLTNRHVRNTAKNVLAKKLEML